MTADRFSVGHALLWAMAAAGFLWVALAALVAVAPGAAYDVVVAGAVEAAVVLGVAALVLRLHAPARPPRSLLGLRPTHPALGASGVALGMLLHLPSAALGRGMERLVPTPSDELARRALLLEIDGPGQLLAMVAVVACVVPLVEELLVRGALFGLVGRESGRTVAAVVTTIGFLLLHLLNWRHAPTLILTGAVLGYLRAVSGSLLPGLALHVTFNATAVLVVAAGAASATRPFSPTSGMVGLGGLGIGLVLVFSGWVATRSPEAALARAEDEE
ncbi:MAG: CPBP family intramembrane metalloprotease [Polyangiaceae bacterium]|nr:CPBP family intramembrane metalloprotease [Polyangiaceae bacterium]